MNAPNGKTAKSSLKNSDPLGFKGLRRYWFHSCTSNYSNLTFITFTYYSRWSLPQAQVQVLGLRQDKNKGQERDMNMAHRPDKEQDMVHKPVPGTDMGKVPGTEHRLDMVPELDMVPGQKKASELAPAPAQSSCISLTAGRKVLCCLIDNRSCFPWCLVEIYCTQLFDFEHLAPKRKCCC